MILLFSVFSALQEWALICIKVYPLICRIFDSLSSDHAEALSDAFKEAEKERAAKLSPIKKDYLQNSEAVFSEYLQNRIASEGLKLSDEEIEDLVRWAKAEGFFKK